jgi:hypothetical protein
VEIGGWDRFNAFSNPPLSRLAAEVARFPKWLLWQALLSPKLELVHADAETTGAGHYKITFVVQNTGWLPTYLSKRALERQTVRGVVAELTLPAGATLAQGKPILEVGQLEGRAYKHTGISFWGDANITEDRVKIEWLVRGKAGDVLHLTARHERAGVVRADVTLR